ncbi:hypothetical protein CVS41_14215 [Aeromonas veronii]|nr:hypothetical protein CVS41_14215 [Aeromonas veronii]
MERLFKSIKIELESVMRYMSLREVKWDISYGMMNYCNWRRPHRHNEVMSQAEVLPNQVPGFSRLLQYEI